MIVTYFLVGARVARLQIDKLCKRLQRLFGALQVTLADRFTVQRLTIAGVVTDFF